MRRADRAARERITRRTSLYTYFEAALDSRVGAWVWDGGELDHQQRVFGLASYLLVSGLWSGYSVLPGTERALYELNPGLPSSTFAPQPAHPTSTGA